MANYYGSIDLTKLGQIVRQHPELVRVVNMKDNSVHQFIGIDINEKQQADQYGNVAYLKVSCKKAERKEGLNYYLCDLKPSQQQQSPAAVAQQPAATEAADNSDDLPF